MERETTFTNPPNHPSYDSSSPTAVYFCSLCDKPFINGRNSSGAYVSTPSYLKFGTESSRHRHLRYCGSRTRNRPRSCRACNAAKIKCSFETPCSRCMKKSIECVYDGAAAVGRRALPTSSGAARNIGARLWCTPSASLAPWSLHADNGTLSNASVAFTDHPAMDDAQLQFASGNSHPSVDLSTQAFSLNESLTLDGLLAFEDYTSGQPQVLSDASVAPCSNLDQQSAPWCSWARGGVSLSVVTENPMVELDSNLLAVLQTERPHAQHSANLVIQSLRSFPTMMLRRETFPWFIHPHSQLLSKPVRAALPEALSTCMSIAQMFASRTSETKPFLWCTIRAEYRRFTNEVRILPTPCSSQSDHPKKHHMSIFELLAAMQACMIYLVMCIVDQSRESEETSLELLMALHAGPWFYS